MSSIVLEGPAQRMSAFDAGFLYFEKPNAPLGIGCVAVLRGSISQPELIRHLDERLQAIPRYRERAVPAPLSLAHPSWLPDPRFDVRNHVQRAALPWPGSEAELCEAVGQLFARPLERSRPLWETQLLEGLSDGRSALVQRVHHCMVDGVAGTGILDALLDPNGAQGGERPRSFADDPEAGRLPPPIQRLGRAVSDSTVAALHRSRQLLGVLQHPGQLAQMAEPAREVIRWVLSHALDAPSRMPWNEPIGPRRSVGFTRFSLEDARVIRSVHGSTVNDVVLSVLAGGLRRYLESIGIDPTHRAIVATVPVDVRSATQRSALGNRLGLLLVPLVLGPTEEPERLALTTAITRKLKQTRGYAAVAALLAAGDLLPPPLAAWLGSRISLPALPAVIATNVHGPAQPRTLAGRPVEAIYPIVPIADRLGLGLAVLSYAGSLCVGVNADPDRVPDLPKLCAGLEEAMALLRASC